MNNCKMNSIKRGICFALALILSLSLLAGCGSSGADTAAKTRTVLDMNGRTVEVPEKVERVFAGWFQGGLHMLTLGAFDKLVAISPYFTQEGFPWVYEIGSNMDGVTRDQAPFNNLEALLAYKPDVVFTLADEDLQPEDYEKLGIPAVVVRFTDYESYMKSIALMGEVLGGEHAEIAQRFCDYFTGNMDLVSQRLANLSEDEKPLVHFVNSKVDNALFVKGHDQIEATWVKMAGGIYSAEEYTGSVEITEEKLLQIDPDLILMGDIDSGSAMNWLLANETLQNLKAVQNNQVYRCPQGIFPWDKMAPEASMQMVWAAKLLHPEYFEDIDMAAMAKEFYQEFYNADVSDEYIAKILSGHHGPNED